MSIPSSRAQLFNNGKATPLFQKFMIDLTTPPPSIHAALVDEGGKPMAIFTKYLDQSSGGKAPQIGVSLADKDGRPTAIMLKLMATLT